MIYVHTNERHARLAYVCDVIINHIWGLSWEWADTADTLPGFGYKTPAHPVHIPACGLLSEKTIHPHWEAPKADGFDGDILAAAFWWMTGHIYYANPQFDHYERYDYTAYSHIQAGTHKQPWVHVYADMLWEKITHHFPDLRKPQKTYQGHITIDIDHPWRFRHKPAYVQLLGMAKRKLTGQWADVWQQWGTWLGKTDPYDTYETVFANCPPEATTVFFQIERHHKQDTRHTWRHSAVKNLIQDFYRRGYSCGIHPSFTSFLSLEKIISETQHLADIIGEPVEKNRMHFLKFRFPNTFRALRDAGIQDDYSTGLYHEGGFLLGMAQPFPWFDLDKNEASSLMLHPTIVMDRTLLSYLGLTPGASEQVVKDLITTVRAASGTFVLLIHQDALSDYGEWEGWKETILNLIDLVISPNTWHLAR